MDSMQLAQLKQHVHNNTYVPHGDVSEADCVIGFSFGYIKDEHGVQPGKSNEQIARYIEEHFPTTPLILQSEISQALKSRQAELVIRKARNEGEYLHSREIAEQAQICMKKNNWQTAIIVTHLAMMARNDALCKKLGIKTVLPAGLDAIEYDAQSVQPWTRNKASWWK